MSFKFEGTTITARKLSIGDNDDIGDVFMKLPESRRINRMFRFIEFAFAFEAKGGKFPVPKLTAASSAEDVEAAYQAYRQLPRGFMAQWLEELQAVEGDPKA